MARKNPRLHLGDRHLAVAFVLLVLTLLAAMIASDTGAVFTKTGSNPGNAIAALRVDPPAGQSPPVSAAAGAVNLSWSATPTSPGTGHTLDYLVLRGPVGGPYAQVGATSALAFTDTPPADGTYEYVVQARVTGGGALTSGNSAARTGLSDRAAPSATASSQVAGDVAQLTVSASYADAGVGASSVSLFAKGPGQGSYALVSTQAFSPSASGTRTFSYTANAGAGTYSFYAVGSDAVGNAGVAPGSAQSTTLLDLDLKLKRTTANDGVDYDLVQGYAPSGGDAQCAFPSSACTWATGTYGAAQSIPAGTWTPRIYAENDVSTIAYRGVVFRASGGVTTVTRSTPVATVAGDIMIAPVSVLSGVSIIAPAGWNFVARGDNGTAIGTAFWWRVATAADEAAGASYTWTFSGTTDAVMAIQVWSGVDTTNPIDSYAFAATSGTAHSAAVTTTVPNAGMGGWFAIAANGSFSQTQGWTEVYDAKAGSISRSGERMNTPQATAGPSGTITATSTVSADGEVLIVALRPAPRTCVLTVDVLKNSTVIGATTVGVTGPSSALYTSSLAPGAVSFASGDRLKLRVTNPGGATCAPVLHFDGGGAVSQLTHP